MRHLSVKFPDENNHSHPTSANLKIIASKQFNPNAGAIQGPINSNSLGGTNWPLRGSKWTIWEGGVKVPAFVRGPGIAPGSTTSELFHITDWVPTLARLAGVETKMELDGVDQTGFVIHHHIDGFRMKFIKSTLKVDGSRYIKNKVSLKP